jgi:hypothetical protein
MQLEHQPIEIKLNKMLLKDKDRYVEQITQDETLLAEGYLNFEWPCIYKEMKTTEFPS